MLDVKQQLMAVKMAMEDERLRWIMGKEKSLLEEGNMYGEKISKEKYDMLMDEIIAAELIRKKILVLVNEEPQSVNMLSEKSGLNPQEIFKNMVTLLRKGLVEMNRIQGNTPFYCGLKVQK